MQQLSVTSLVRYLKNKLDTDTNIQNIIVCGEISNYHRHFSGHLYFTLKDETSQISCVMFKSYAAHLNFEPKTGDKVIVKANTSIFEASGQMQLYITKINLDGLGELYEKYEALKNKLEANGIFDDSNKITLDKYFIEKVAVLVGDKSAAMSDIKTTFSRRWPLCKVDYYPVLVQGNDAAKNIIDTLKDVDNKKYDAIILARGGGSFEDLFCFNDENLVMTIYKLKTFIITGIGHEQDYTLADFVADQRAATPTASVELITPNFDDVKEMIYSYEDSLISSMNNIINTKKMLLDVYLEKIISYQKNFNIFKNDINNLINNMKIIIKNKVQNYNLEIKRYTTLLNAYSTDNTLKRGYSLVFQDGKVIKKKKELKKDVFDIHFIDGTIKAKGV